MFSSLREMGLQRRIMLLVAGGLLVTFGVLGYFGLRAVQESTQLVFHERVTLARAIAAEVDSALDQTTFELLAVTTPPSDVADRSAWIQGELAVLYDHLASHYRWSHFDPLHMGLVDHTGRLVWVRPGDSELVGLSLAQNPGVARVLTSGTVAVVPTILRRDPGESTVTLIVPVRDAQGRVEGVAFADLDPLFRVGILAPSSQLSDAGYHVEVITEEGQVVAGLGGFSAPGRRSGHFPLIADALFSHQSLAARHRMPPDHPIKDHVVAFVPTTRAPWGVMVEQAQDVALEMPNALQQRMLVLSVLTLLVALVMAWITTRAIVRPVRLLIAASQRIAAGRLDEPVASAGGDEVGRLARAFDDMRTQLKASRAEIEAWNRTLEERVQQKTQELVGLFEASQALTSTLETEAVLNAVAAHAQRLFPTADAGILYLYQEETNLLVARASFGLRDTPGPAIEIAIADHGQPSAETNCCVEGHCEGQVWLARQVRLCYPATLPLGATLATSANAEMEAMCVPLIYEDAALGTICLYRRRAEAAFSPSEVQLLQALANQAAVAIENARLFKEASVVGTLREMDRQKTAFVATASHELRTPLTSIKSLAETLLRSDLSLPPEEQREFLEGINNASDRLARIITDLLTLSRIEAGRVEVRSIATAALPLIGKIVEQFRFQEPARDIQLIAPSDLPPVLADADRVQDVLGNLLSNAVKYSPPGQPIRVRVELRDARDHDPETAERVASAIVSVADEGPGIAAQELDRLFKRFSRVDSPVTRAVGGVGLGLFISKTYVEAMGGSIWVESAPRKGSTFSFSLPLATSLPGVSSAVAVANGDYDSSQLNHLLAERGLLGSRVLVVDDEESVLRTACINLQASGFQTYTATNGQEALEVARKRKPHVIVLDIVLPGMDGLEVARLLRQNPATRPIPLVLLTARAQAEDEAEGLRAGADLYITKPFSPQRLCTAVSRILLGEL